MTVRMKVTAVALAIGVMACGRSTDSTSLDDSLKSDLALASAQSVGLAQYGAKPALVVSSLEQVKQKRSTPSARRSIGRAPEPIPETTLMGQEPEQTVEVEAPVAIESDAAPEQVAVAEPSPVLTPAPAPEPAPTPTGHGDNNVGDHDRGSRGRGGLGGVIGVVIRGGIAGIDDCDPRGHRRGRGPMIAINDRMPRGTFPGTAGLPRF